MQTMFNVIVIVIVALIVLLVLLMVSLHFYLRHQDRQQAKHARTKFKKTDEELVGKMLEQMDAGVINDPDVVKLLMESDAVMWNGTELKRYKDGKEVES